jgi:hypothetical protein
VSHVRSVVHVSPSSAKPSTQAPQAVPVPSADAQARFSIPHVDLQVVPADDEHAAAPSASNRRLSLRIDLMLFIALTAP